MHDPCGLSRESGPRQRGQSGVSQQLGAPSGTSARSCRSRSTAAGCSSWWGSSSQARAAWPSQSPSAWWARQGRRRSPSSPVRHAACESVLAATAGRVAAERGGQGRHAVPHRHRDHLSGRRHSHTRHGGQRRRRHEGRGKPACSAGGSGCVAQGCAGGAAQHSAARSVQQGCCLTRRTRRGKAWRTDAVACQGVSRGSSVSEDAVRARAAAARAGAGPAWVSVEAHRALRIGAEASASSQLVGAPQQQLQYRVIASTYCDPRGRDPHGACSRSSRWPAAR